FPTRRSSDLFGSAELVKRLSSRGEDIEVGFDRGDIREADERGVRDYRCEDVEIGARVDRGLVCSSIDRGKPRIAQSTLLQRLGVPRLIEVRHVCSQTVTPTRSL